MVREVVAHSVSLPDCLFENLEGGATLEQFLDWFPEWGTSYRPSQKRSATSTRSRSEALSRPNGFGETTERGTVKTLSAITSDGCCSPFAAAASMRTRNKGASIKSAEGSFRKVEVLPPVVALIGLIRKPALAPQLGQKRLRAPPLGIRARHASQAAARVWRIH